MDKDMPFKAATTARNPMARPVTRRAAVLYSKQTESPIRPNQKPWVMLKNMLLVRKGMSE